MVPGVSLCDAAAAQIQKYALFIDRDELERSRLSHEEEGFLSEYVALKKAHFESSALRHFPERFQGIDDFGTRRASAPIVSRDVQRGVQRRRRT